MFMYESMGVYETHIHEMPLDFHISLCANIIQIRRMTRFVLYEQHLTFQGPVVTYYVPPGLT
jgi:hypothetical protein